ncbi:MAG: L-histidine N(alpha)-methyltransferase [Alphaproteobacteria bacterium]
MPDNHLAFFIDLEPAVADFRESVIAGLSGSPRQLACKFFYDAAGMELFNRICETEEYYVTRTELALLRRIGPEIAALAGPEAAVIEFGAGSDLKIRLLLDALDRPAQYVPIDIAIEPLRDATEAIARDYPAMRVGAVCADFTTLDALPAGAVSDSGGRRLGFFPGSTIGNFTREEAGTFMALIRRVLGPGGALLIGVDLKKDTARLNAAYNDAAGYTAGFNLNLLHRMVRELGAELDTDGFEHYAFYNDAEGRVEMHLRSLRDQTIAIGDDRFALAAGELIHSENSHKYAIDEFAALARAAGFDPGAVWTDANRLFSIHYLTIAD